ncbi:hypothetical protein [Anaeromyxobacter dehalogenans]|uniref:hypothetical protein n=1 Tax=Anaeromyxobacter dehalogenans TaxID=161493 RepID=UPI001237738C|nr:hypothetical protein [Anaeromyxobacter dehalogenans]
MMIGLFLGYVPGAALLGGALVWFVGSPLGFMIAGAGLLAALWWADARFASFRCPSCGERFMVRRYELALPGIRKHQFSARRCVNCGLARP